VKILNLLLSAACAVAACGPAAPPQPTPLSPTAIPPTSVPATASPPTDRPSPTATSAPVEAQVGAMTDLVGLWWFSKCPCKVEFKPDGSYRILGFTSPVPEAEGNFALDAGKLTWVTSQPLCNDRPATYGAYVIRQDGKLVGLRLQLVGSDPCAMRVDAFKGPAKFLNP
jgi:hypothetical protein